MTGMDIDQLDTAPNVGLRRGGDAAQAAARIEFTAADHRAVPVEGDLAGQFTRDVPLPRRRRGRSRLFRGGPLVRQPTR